FFSVIADHCFGQRAKPPPVRRESIDANRIAPSGVIVAAVAGCAALLNNNPAVDRKNPAPTHRARDKSPDHRIWMLRYLGKKASARAVCRLPVPTPLATEVIDGR